MVFANKYVLIFYYVISSNGFLYTLADEDKPELKFIFSKLEKEIETNDVITTNISIENRGDVLYVNGEVKQFLDLDNDWKVQFIIFRADNANDEYSKMPLPLKGVCDTMKSYYKTYFYDSLKNYANAPDPEKCPVTKETYLIKDYPVDTNRFKKLFKLGYYRISGSVLTNDVEKLKYVIHGYVEEVK